MRTGIRADLHRLRFTNPCSTREISSWVCPLAVGNTSFILMRNVWARVIELGVTCTRVAAEAPPNQWDFPRNGQSGKSSYLRVESLGLQQSWGDLRRQWRKARGGSEPRRHFTFYLDSKFQSSCPHLPSLFPTLIPTPRHYSQSQR